MLAVAENHETFSLIRSALTDLGSGLDVQRVKSGQHALQFLQKNSPYERVEAPQLVIIDTASFARDAWPGLAEVQREVGLHSLPVVVVGSEPASQHGMNSSALGGQFYVLKSLDHEAFRQQLKEACQFLLWVFALERASDRIANGPLGARLTKDQIRQTREQ